MRAFVTGAAGFVGGALVRQLIDRGDSVTAAVRDAPGAGHLAELGCQLVALDLAAAEPSALVAGVHGAEAVFHAAGSYRIGIRATQRSGMYAANVIATRRVLDAAIAAGTPRVIHTSTANVFGDTKGRVPDESFRRPTPPRFLSFYDETKYLAHLAAEERIASGAAIMIAIPGMVYGPGDHSQVGMQIRQAMAGTLRALAAPDLGGNLVHVDDLAAGMLLIHDRGEIGESYLLGGEIARLREVIARAAALAGRRPPRLTIPSWLLRGVAPVGGIIGSMVGRGPDLGEMVRASAGVTYWFSDARARVELGYAPRDLEAGLRTLLPT
ncbi:MAG TPA: NAD-dependent epimerase/dehydratase family protein [Candidatus Limnocylindrales bacterium]|nr:NAD-dependent epimerase/dehydratase family protein [Candidatus Limnocylindrales bacterium]